MKEFFKKRYSSKASLDLLWRLTPSPHWEGLKAANDAQANHQRKAKWAIRVMTDNTAAPKSWVRKKAEGWLELDVAWCRLAIAEAMRWSVCRGAELPELLQAAAAVPAIPVSLHERERRRSELTATILGSGGDALLAFKAAIELHAVLLPTFDISDAELLAVVVNDHISTRPLVSTAVNLSVTAAIAGLAFALRASVAAFVAMLFASLGAQVIAGVLAYHAGRFFTKGVAPFVARSGARTYALWRVSRQLP